MGKNPFERFAQRKNELLAESAKRQDEETARRRSYWSPYNEEHEQLLRLLSTVNVEGIIFQLWNVGFKGNPKFPESKIYRNIVYAGFNERHELLSADFSEQGYCDKPNLSKEMDRVTSARGHDSGAYRAPRGNKYLIRRVDWDLRLWFVQTSRKLEYGGYDKSPFGVSVKASSGGVTVAGKLLETCNPHSLAEALADATDAMIERRNR